MATAFLIALTLATPVRWTHRFGALLLGLAWFNGYIAVRLAAHFSLLYSLDPFPWLPFAAFKRNLLGSVGYLQWYVMPIFIWGSTVSYSVHAELFRGSSLGGSEGEPDA